MVSDIKRLLVGQPLENAAQHHQRLTKVIALAVFSSDALSSVAYATEAILFVLVAAGTGALVRSIAISVGIVLLLLIVGFSYRQTIYAYPSGGGAYIVARENLGDTAGLIAAASLLIDYVLTVAVSISAGVAAITSLAANWGLPQLASYRVDIALVCVAIVTVVNLRGVKESGAIFAVPTYVFVVSMLGMIAAGLWQSAAGGAHPAAAALPEARAAAEPLTLFLVLKAFAAGCTALTGVEAISNGVPAFKQPESRNASTTLLAMVLLLGAMFLGISVLAHSFAAVPVEGGETVVSQIARQVLGVGPLYSVIQVATALILVLAANTSFADFPRLASLLSRDRYLPRQFASRGDRLVFSNGIVALGLFAALLVIVFDAREQAMLPLYAIGVFISFTLSQGGMVQHWLRAREPGWRRSVAINALGAALTAVVLCVIVLTKFTSGAWAVIVLMPILVVLFRSIHTHYAQVASQLSLQTAPVVRPVMRNTVLVLVSGMHRGVIPALQFAKALSPDNVTALYVDLDEAEAERMREKWQRWASDIPLEVLSSPYRSLIRPVLRYIDELDARYSDDVLSVIVPEFVPSRWWQHLLHNQTALILKTTLLFRRNIVVISVPYHLS
jgi:amino acid transporter